MADPHDVNELDGAVPMFGTALSGPLPSLIADLRSIEHDLRYASRLFTRVAAIDSDGDADLRQALFDAGVIAYRRGFTTGRSLVTKGGPARRFLKRSSTRSTMNTGGRMKQSLRERTPISLTG